MCRPPERQTCLVREGGTGWLRLVAVLRLLFLGSTFFGSARQGGLDRPYEGLGTGVALCRKLADAMGAQLEFVSTPGQGTTVRLGLRAA